MWARRRDLISCFSSCLDFPSMMGCTWNCKFQIPFPYVAFGQRVFIKATNDKQNRRQVKRRKVSVGALWETLSGKADCHTESVPVSQGTVPPVSLIYASAIGM